MDSQSIITLGTSLIVGISTVIGSAVTAYFGHRSVQLTSEMASIKDKIASTNRELIMTYRQISAYYQLEQDLIAAMSAASGESPATLKIKFRDAVVGQGFNRPEVTNNYAERRIRELEI